MVEHELPEDEALISRSQRRRDALDVLELAEQLCLLKPSQLAEVPLSEALLDAVKLAQRIPSHIAHKRQVHYLAKLLRKQDDLDPIRAAVRKPEDVRRRETAELHRLERWRERLIDEGDAALEALLSEFPHADRQRLRTLARQAVIERDKGRSPTSARSLFQELKQLVADRPEDSASA